MPNNFFLKGHSVNIIFGNITFYAAEFECMQN